MVRARRATFLRCSFGNSHWEGSLRTEGADWEGAACGAPQWGPSRADGALALRTCADGTRREGILPGGAPPLRSLPARAAGREPSQEERAQGEAAHWEGTHGGGGKAPSAELRNAQHPARKHRRRNPPAGWEGPEWRTYVAPNGRLPPQRRKAPSAVGRLARLAPGVGAFAPLAGRRLPRPGTT